MTVTTVPERRLRSNARMRVFWRLRLPADQRLVGHDGPLQVTVSLAARGALTVNEVIRAPSADSRPRIRTTGAGFITLLAPDSCRTWPAVGTGVGAGVATKSPGTGVGSGVATGVGSGVTTGVAVGVGVGATLTGPRGMLTVSADALW